MTLLYLSSPYSDPDPKIRLQRYHKAMEACSILVSQNFFVFSPVVHWHQVALEFELPSTFEFWKSYNEELIKRCDAIIVLTLPGWRESIGVSEEMRIAKGLGKHIETIDNE